MKVSTSYEYLRRRICGFQDQVPTNNLFSSGFEASQLSLPSKMVNFSTQLVSLLAVAGLISAMPTEQNALAVRAPSCRDDLPEDSIARVCDIHN
jgi:hypothetical protein